MELINKIKEEFAAFDGKRKALATELRKEFPSLLAPLFEKSKKIESVAWSQYTPYFNDGDECVFGVRNDELEINGEDEYSLPWYDWRVKHFLTKGEYRKEIESNSALDIEECKIIQEFKDVLSSIPDEVYRDLFGDHVQVIVRGDGTIETEEAEHD